MSDHGRAHATLSPSSAERWLECPASIHMTETLGRSDDGSSLYAEEGTRAHNLAEIEAAHEFGLTTDEQYRAFKAQWLRTAEAHGDDVEEMERHVRVYVTMLRDLMTSMGPGTTVYLEKRLQTGVPGCWGTGDAILVNASQVAVIDFKYGAGVVVRAEENPQLKLYGLGVLEMFGDILGITETVGMHICQPRAGGQSHFTMTANDLGHGVRTRSSRSPGRRRAPTPGSGLARSRVAGVRPREPASLVCATSPNETSATRTS